MAAVWHLLTILNGAVIRDAVICDAESFSITNHSRPDGK